jgi:hypothetical protein
LIAHHQSVFTSWLARISSKWPTDRRRQHQGRGDLTSSRTTGVAVIPDLSGNEGKQRRMNSLSALEYGIGHLFGLQSAAPTAI